MSQEKIGAFTWADLGFPERREIDRRHQHDRRDGWREWLRVVAKTALTGGVSEDDFVLAFIADKRNAARQVFQEEAARARLARKQQ